MITKNQTGYGTFTYRGLSTDEKPQDAENGAEFYDIDTGDYWYYDKENLTWHKASARWM